MTMKNIHINTAALSSTAAAVLCIFLAAVVLSGCVEALRDNPYDPKSDDYRIGIVTQDPANETLIIGDQTITIQFSDSMDTDTLVLGGDLGGASSSWSTTEKLNDTLELSPSGTIWPSEGPAKSLSIVCDSVNGISTGTIVQQYEVFYGVFVSENGDDLDPGTISEPKKTVQAGIDKADGLYTIGEVRVAGGEYKSDYQGTTDPVADMAEGISLYGGYSADFSNHDPDVYTTVLQDTSSADSGPNRAVNIGSGVTNSTIITGFVIIAGVGGENASIVNVGNPTIAENLIQGLSAGFGGLTYGIYSSGGNPVIEKNIISQIYAGMVATCLYLENSTAEVRNNIILPGTSAGITRGIHDRINSDSHIYNNIIDCGLGNASDGGRCLYVEVSNPAVVNNIFTNQRGNSTVCAIYEVDADSDPAEVSNNNFFDVYDSNTMYHDGDGDGDLLNVSAMETDLDAEGITATGNLNNINPEFESPPSDFHLTSSTPASIRAGGIDGGPAGDNWGFSDDLDGNDRTGNGTDGWSIGPYEYD